MNSALWHVVIVNYKTAGLAVRAARAARRALPDSRIVVVDSASGDQCKELLAAHEDVEYLGLSENRGYGAALNAGVSGTQSEYLLLLNADLELAPDTVGFLQAKFETLPSLGIVAPRLMSSDGSVQPSCRRFPTHWSLWTSRGSPLAWLSSPSTRTYRVPEPNSFTLTDVVAGACLAVRHSTWEELGGMDPSFLLFVEDTDFCYRAKQTGWLVGYEPATSVRHEWGASRRQVRRQSNRQHAESLSRYFYKHSPGRPWANRCVTWLLRMHARLRF